MALATLCPMLDDALRGGYAVGAYNCVNAETARVVIETGERLGSPVMLIAAPFETELMGASFLVETVKLLAARVSVPVCLHLDHADNPADVAGCIEAGFPSVMIDASSQPFEENIRITREVVAMAHPRGVTVEAELGAVGRVDDETEEGAGDAGLTEPGQAAEFVRRTKADALAVSIGNAHGLYRQQPELDFERLAAIRDAVDIPLVLHGGSGTPEAQLQRAIRLGICKVNVASELCRSYLTTLTGLVEASQGKIWWARAMRQAVDTLPPIVERWMKTLGSTGRIGMGQAIR